jgi:hypothetical protein
MVFAGPGSAGSAVGLWLQGLPGLAISTRSLEDPLAILTCGRLRRRGWPVVAVDNDPAGLELLRASKILARSAETGVVGTGTTPRDRNGAT